MTVPGRPCPTRQRQVHAPEECGAALPLHLLRWAVSGSTEPGNEALVWGTVLQVRVEL